MSILGYSMMKKILRQPVVKEVRTETRYYAYRIILHFYILEAFVLFQLLAFVTVSMCFFLQGFTFTYNAFINVGEDGVTAEQASVSGNNFSVTIW